MTSGDGPAWENPLGAVKVAVNLRASLSTLAKHRVIENLLKQVQELPGVAEVTVEMSGSEASVTLLYDPSITTPDALAGAVIALVSR